MPVSLILETNSLPEAVGHNSSPNTWDAEGGRNPSSRSDGDTLISKPAGLNYYIISSSFKKVEYARK